ncbi:hypothetical protein BX666DRAFT_1873326 [Dichotomocladium elegans]|nr:hypothetical protein BX666DRAFT_1873326 [Dichotomocladium elegans]
MDSTTSSSSFDFVAALVKAMEHDDGIEGCTAEDWPAFMPNPIPPNPEPNHYHDTNTSDDLGLFPLDHQRQSVTISDSCLSLLHAPASPPSITGSSSSSSSASINNVPSQSGLDKQWSSPWRYPAASDCNAASTNAFLPPTPPVESSMAAAMAAQHALSNGQFPPWFGIQLTASSEPSPSPAMVDPFSSMCYLPSYPAPAQLVRPQQHQQQCHHSTSSNPPISKATPRRRSAPSRPYRRRSSSHPSVASVVSLSAHEPVAHTINGIEHITFLYSHDRLVKEYTVRTDIDSCSSDDIPADFRMVNAIYPRANVDKEEYDGNRWEYETSCNQLGWKLCWLNQDQLCGRRGLIQRAVDSYRNRHAEMRSRRVTRQEKVANGTLRRRRAKKS